MFLYFILLLDCNLSSSNVYNFIDYLLSTISVPEQEDIWTAANPLPEDNGIL
jgi:hypothetical protein